MKEWIVEWLAEKTTWLGFFTAAAAFGLELTDAQQSALASVQEDYWRGRIASTKEALKLVRGTYRRVSMGEQDV